MSLKYTNIQHEFRKEQKLSCHEYILCDMVSFLSKNIESRFPGWCYASKDFLAEEIGIGRQTLFNLLNSMIEAGFIIRDEKTKYLRTSTKWESVYFRKDSTESVLSAKKVVQKVESRSTESVLGDSTENVLNNNTNDNYTDNKISTTLSGSSQQENKKPVSEELKAGKQERKKVAAKKEKPVDKAWQPCCSIYDAFANKMGIVLGEDFWKKNGKAMSSLMDYLRSFMNTKMNRVATDEEVVEGFRRVFANPQKWGKFESRFKLLNQINQYKETILANCYNGREVKPGETAKDTKKILDDYANL